MSQADKDAVQNLFAKRQDACDCLQAHRKGGNTEGAWFHLGFALALQEVLVELGESDGSDLPCAHDASALLDEAPEEERGMRLGLLFEAIGDMDFADYLTPEQAQALALYRNRVS